MLPALPAPLPSTTSVLMAFGLTLGRRDRARPINRSQTMGTGNQLMGGSA